MENFSFPPFVAFGAFAPSAVVPSFIDGLFARAAAWGYRAKWVERKHGTVGKSDVLIHLNANKGGCYADPHLTAEAAHARLLGYPHLESKVRAGPTTQEDKEIQGLVIEKPNASRQRFGILN